MSNKTIAKFSGLVILLIAAGIAVNSCSHASSRGRSTANSAELSQAYNMPVAVGRIESGDVIESSGLAASLCQPNVFWTHNDSGDDAFIFAMTPQGKHLGTWRVTDAKNSDWEDMAAYKAPDGNCFLYLGDIGNNKLGKVEQRIYRLKEPAISDGDRGSSRKAPLPTEPADVAVFRYSDTPHDAETMLVQPQTSDVYVLTKRLDGPSLVFKFRPQFGSDRPVIAEKVGEVSVPAVPNGLLTGGSISADGKRVVLCDYSSGYELELGNAATFDNVWSVKPIRVDLGERRQGEAVAFSSDGGSILATSERKNSSITEVRRK